LLRSTQIDTQSNAGGEEKKNTRRSRKTNQEEKMMENIYRFSALVGIPKSFIFKRRVNSSI
jgi:hypothetical protein